MHTRSACEIDLLGILMPSFLRDTYSTARTGPGTGESVSFWRCDKYMFHGVEHVLGLIIPIGKSWGGRCRSRTCDLALIRGTL